MIILYMKSDNQVSVIAMIWKFCDKTKLVKFFNLFTRLHAFQIQTLMSSHVDSTIGDDVWGELGTEELSTSEWLGALDVPASGTKFTGWGFAESTQSWEFFTAAYSLQLTYRPFKCACLWFHYWWGFKQDIFKFTLLNWHIWFDCYAWWQSTFTQKNKGSFKGSQEFD